MRCVIYIGSPWLLSLVFWTGFVACIDAPVPDTPPISRIVTAWDPLECGDQPHRVVVELEDEGGAMLSASAPCAIAGVTLDAPHFGLYRGRIYAWQQVDHEPEVRSEMPVRLTVDEPIVHWFVMAPK